MKIFSNIHWCKFQGTFSTVILYLLVLNRNCHQSRIVLCNLGNMIFVFKIKMSFKKYSISYIRYIHGILEYFPLWHIILKCLCVTLTILENMRVICHQPVLWHKYQNWELCYPRFCTATKIWYFSTLCSIYNYSFVEKCLDFLLVFVHFPSINKTIIQVYSWENVS